MSQSSRALPLVFGLLASGALALTALSARSQTPPASTYVAPTAPAPTPARADPAASASGSASAGAKVGLLRGADIPTEVSDPPKDKKDWATGIAVVPNIGELPVCALTRLREWLRIDCQPRIGAALIAGEPTDVSVWAWGDPFAAISQELAKSGVPMPSAVIVLPLRRGESRVFDLEQIESGWDWVGPASAERISIAWRDGSPDPVILVAGRH